MPQVAVVCEFEDCDLPLPPYSGKGRPPKYHPACKRLKDKRDYRARHNPPKDRLTKPINSDYSESTGAVDGRSQHRRPPDEFIRDGWAFKIGSHGWTTEKVAAKFEVQRPTVTRWMAWVKREAARAEERGEWERGKQALAALENFKLFRDTYFTDRKGRPYYTKPFHQEWIDAIYHAYQTGGQLAILAPPRHGKTDLLVAFMCWLIIKHPNISILWVAKSADLAEKAVGMVMKQLETNERLINDYLGPNGSFKPPRTGTRWTRQEFTVATRDIHHKSPTIAAIGSGGTLLSRDADFIVGDDIEDDQTTRQPAQRKATQGWWSKDLESRKEEETGWVYIGSRQHPEDLCAHLVGNPEWKTLIYSAHDEDCTLPWTVETIDEHVECMLFPEVRSARWLFKKRRSIDNDGVFEMQYLNKPRSDGMTIFPREVVEECRDWSRRLGDVPPGTRLVAGLDPSGSSGYQAAVLWAVHVASNTRFLVDVENVQGGGVVHMRSIIERWSLKYPGLTEWVVEQNIVEDTLATDVPLRELKQRLGFRFVPHKTGRNKWDLRMGVPGLKPAFEDKRINLPYGDDETRGRVEVLVNQFVNFTDNVSSHQTSYKTDLVMAAWFPEPTIQGWQREILGGMEVQYGRGQANVRLDGLFGGSN